jgi:hypothetical protein
MTVRQWVFVAVLLSFAAVHAVALERLNRARHDAPPSAASSVVYGD